VYVQRNIRTSAWGFVVDYIGIGADVVLAVVAFMGTYYASVSSRLFKGDPIMERVWRLATIAFVTVLFFSALDFIFTVTGSPLAQLHLARISAAFALIVFVVAIMTLVRWGRSSTEPKTQQSQQYRPG
jgi:uncharacterized membrane protein YfhO